MTERRMEILCRSFEQSEVACVGDKVDPPGGGRLRRGLAPSLAAVQQGGVHASVQDCMREPPQLRPTVDIVCT